MSDSDSPNLPEAGRDPADPNDPSIEEENSTPDPPLSAPGMDMELTGTNEVDKDDYDQEDGDQDDLSDDDDLESLLSEVDEAQFDDFNPANVALGDREAIPVDESTVKMLGVHKRKRGEAGDEGGTRRLKKKKDGKKDKPKRLRRRNDDDDDGAAEDARFTKTTATTKRNKIAVDEESLSKEERRRRALERAMDEALRGGQAKRRKQGGIDLDAMADEAIAEMRERMSKAAEADGNARARGETATHKLNLLPEVISLLNRNTLANQIVDPDNNLLLGVRYFLEPLNDGALPAYNIQRELFNSLIKLPISKDTLVASGIGKVVLFYTRSSRVEAKIKRQAEKLVTDWMRPILRRTADYRKKAVETAHYDPDRSTSSRNKTNLKSTEVRENALQVPILGNRARIESGLANYTVAPRHQAGMGPKLKQPGQSGDAYLRRMKMKQSRSGR